MSVITLDKMEFHAYHGCLEHEKEYGNTFQVTLSMQLDTTKAEKSDNLKDTLNYKEIYDTVSKVMKKRVHLIESLAHNIITEVMHQFPVIKESKLILSKCNPPLGGKVDKVSITLTKKR